MKTKVRATIEEGVFFWTLENLEMYVEFDGTSYSVWEYLPENKQQKLKRKLSESIMRKRLKAANIDLVLY